MRVFCMASVLHHTSFLTTRVTFKLRGLYMYVREFLGACTYKRWQNIVDTYLAICSNMTKLTCS